MIQMLAHDKLSNRVNINRVKIGLIL